MEIRLLRKIFIVFAMFFIVSCDNFDYHPYADTLEGRQNIHAYTLPEIERLCQNKDTIRFAFITDTQGAYDEMHDAVDMIRSRPDIQFVIHGGDQSDFGLIKEFELCHDEMERIGKPYCVLLGNHDCLGTGEHTFESIYGTANYSFNAGFAHFVCLNTVALEYDYSNPVPDFTFIENDYGQVSRLNEVHDSLTSTVVLMHASPYDEQFNNNVAKPFEYYLHSYPGFGDDSPVYSAEYEDTIKAETKRNGLCIFGHIHNTTIRNLFNDGIMYYSCANMEERVFLVFTITKDGYVCEKIEF